MAHECCDHPPKAAWYRSKTVIVAVVLTALILFSYTIDLLVPFRQTFLMYFSQIWWATALGLLLGGVMEHFVPREYVSHILAQSKKRTILRAVILGFFMSVCSHGILALAIQFHKKGASTPAVIAFLLASPWANFTFTLLIISLFGVAKAAYIIVMALVVAVVTGLVYQWLERQGKVERNERSLELDPGFSVRLDIKKRFAGYRLSIGQLKADIAGVWRGAISLSEMVLWWILLGAGLASLAGAYIPTEFFQKYMGPSLLGMLVTLAVATVVEVCSEGSAPMAFEIFRQTGAVGNGFVFLMAGVATDYTEIGLIWHNIGRKAALWLPMVTVPQIVLWGALANMIF